MLCGEETWYVEHTNSEEVAVNRSRIGNERLGGAIREESRIVQSGA